jgi:hypothetical protein
MRPFPLLAGILLLAAWASPAWADWRYARWGMSPAELVAASKGEAKLAAPNKNTNTIFGVTGADAVYKQGPYSFYVTFNFRYDKLTQVTLHQQTKLDCRPLVTELMGRFGLPRIDALGVGILRFFWANTPGANDIRVLQLPETCGILYVQHGVVPAKQREGGKTRPADALSAREQPSR